MNGKSYYVDSIINRISEYIKKYIKEGIISDNKRIVVYGSNTFSFGINTVLKNRGYRTYAYAFLRKIEYIRAGRAGKSTCRYLNSSDNVIKVVMIDELIKNDDRDFVILIASKDYSLISEELSVKGLTENKDFFSVCDWRDDYYESVTDGAQEIELSEMQCIEKDILFYVDDFCIKRGIRYWVCGGTMLGTVRHKGFIPWDDDVDIYMPVPDYTKFVNEFRDQKYGLLSHYIPNRNDFFELYLKVTDNNTIAREDYNYIREIHPVAIDVFPIIGLPDGYEERQLFFAEYYETVHCIWQEFYERNGDMRAFIDWNSRQSEFLEMYDYDRQNYVGVIDTGYRERDCTQKSVYRDTLRMPFEDIEVNVPVGYEEYLTNLYGDWHQLPLVEKRTSHHNMKAYRL